MCIYNYKKAIAVVLLAIIIVQAIVQQDALALRPPATAKEIVAALLSETDIPTKFIPNFPILDIDVDRLELERILAVNGKPLARTQEQTLFKALHSRKYLEDLALRQRILDLIVKKNQGVVGALARDLRRVRNGKYLEAKQDGNVGLLSAFWRYDFRRNVKFSTFARQFIIGEIIDGARMEFNRVKYSRPVGKQLSGVGTARSTLSHKLQREPRMWEIAAEMSVPEKNVVKLLQLEQMQKPLSLQVELGKNGRSELARLSMGNGNIPNDDLASLLSYLKLSDRIALKLRFGIGTQNGGYTHKEIGGILGITTEGARKKEITALKKLRAVAAENNVGGPISSTRGDHADVYITEVLGLLPSDPLFSLLLKKGREVIEHEIRTPNMTPERYAELLTIKNGIVMQLKHAATFETAIYISA